MSTLLELVKDLGWPGGAVCVVQDSAGTVKWLPSMPCNSDCGSSSTSPDSDGDWWFNKAGNGDPTYSWLQAIDSHKDSLASDQKTAIITKEMWEHEQVCNVAPNETPNTGISEKIDTLAKELAEIKKLIEDLHTKIGGKKV